MAGRGKLPDMSTIVEDSRILCFDKNSKWSVAKHPLHYDKPSKCGVGPGLSFAQELVKLGGLTKHRKIGIIPCAVGGSSIKEWLPNPHPQTTSNARPKIETSGNYTYSYRRNRDSISTVSSSATATGKEERERERKIPETDNESTTEVETETETETETDVDTVSSMKVSPSKWRPTFFDVAIERATLSMQSAQCETEIKAILWHQGIVPSPPALFSRKNGIYRGIGLRESNPSKCLLGKSQTNYERISSIFSR